MATQEHTETEDPRTLYDVASDLAEIQDRMRIAEQMMTDELCNCSIGDFDSTYQTVERMLFLATHSRPDIARLESLADELHEMGSAQKANIKTHEMSHVSL